MLKVEMIILLILITWSLGCISNSSLDSNCASNNKYAFGDSITVGLKASEGNDYVNKIARKTGWDIENNGISGSQLEEYSSSIIYTISMNESDTSIMLTGYNDMRNYSTNSSGLNTYTKTLYAVAAWLTIPNSSKIFGTSPNVTYRGNWSKPTIHFAKYSNGSGNASAEVNVSGTTIYYATYQIVNGGNFDVYIDGNKKGSFSNANFKKPVNCTGYSPMLLRFAGLSAGQHILNITVNNSNTSLDQWVYVDWIAGNTGFNSSTLYLGNTIHMNSVGYAKAGPSWNNGNDIAVAEYNSIIKAVADNLSSDGLNVRYVDVDAQYNLSTDIDSDNVHPNDLGHQHIADAFYYTILIYENCLNYKKLSMIKDAEKGRLKWKN